MNQLYLITTVLFSLILGANAFSYKNAENWGKENPQCNGKRESPIFVTNAFKEVIPPMSNFLKLRNFQKLPKKLTIENTGHTVEMKAVWSGDPPKCTGGPLHGNYIFEKATFHWDKKRWLEGEIPLIQEDDHYQYDVDMHMFFYKTDLKSFKQAEMQKGGLAVFKIALQSVPKQEYPDNLFNNLEKNLHKVQSPNSTANVPPFHFANYFDDHMNTFLYYDGSLDYPPCTESATWFILQDFRYFVTEGLVNEFRKINLAEGDVSNVRPVQPLNKRQVRMLITDNPQE